MQTTRYVHWQDGDMWLGYLEKYPDHMIQGETLDELQLNLSGIDQELTSGNIPGVRRVADLQIV